MCVYVCMIVLLQVALTLKNSPTDLLPWLRPLQIPTTRGESPPLPVLANQHKRSISIVVSMHWCVDYVMCTKSCVCHVIFVCVM